MYKLNFKQITIIKKKKLHIFFDQLVLPGISSTIVIAAAAIATAADATVDVGEGIFFSLSLKPESTCYT